MNASRPKDYWDYESLQVTWNAQDNYEVVRKVCARVRRGCLRALAARREGVTEPFRAGHVPQPFHTLLGSVFHPETRSTCGDVGSCALFADTGAQSPSDVRWFDTCATNVLLHGQLSQNVPPRGLCICRTVFSFRRGVPACYVSVLSLHLITQCVQFLTLALLWRSLLYPAANLFSIAWLVPREVFAPKVLRKIRLLVLSDWSWQVQRSFRRCQHDQQ